MIHSVKKITEESYDESGRVTSKTYSEIDEYDYNQYNACVSTPESTEVPETTDPVAQKTPKRCNKCGQKLDYLDLYENVHFHQRLGYGSAHDGDVIKLQLCLKCLDELIDSCAISPVIDNEE